MSAVVDIRPLKDRLRKEVKAWRRALSPAHKAAMDRQICRRVTHLREYAAAETLLTYLSLPIEVDTLRLIKRAWADGKRVAAPRCVDGTREMEFYYIRSMEDLAPRTFGVLEPIPERCGRWRGEESSICIVPALCYDYEGFRLGYGAGYYDRFLSGYKGVKIGIIYSHNLRRSLWHGRYDVAVDLLATERRLLPVRVIEAPPRRKQ